MPVRSLSEQDLPAVAELYRDVFRRGERRYPGELRDYEAYLRWIFLESPWRDSDMMPLVFEAGGKVAGFLGVVSRRFVFRGRPLRAALSSHFMVDPASRSLGAGPKLMDAFFAGPQDFSFTDGSNDLSRAIWEGLGGETALAYSIRWTWPLRPARFALHMVGRRATAVERAVAPLANLLDYPAARLPKSPFRRRAPEFEGRPLDAALLARCVEDCGMSLRPDYDGPWLDPLLARAQTMTDRGSLQKVMVTGPGGRPAGWYVYYLNQGGQGEVVQLHAVSRNAPAVMAHMLHHAWERGAAALAGALPPRMVSAFPEYGGFLRRGAWTLIHSREPGLREAFHRGDAFCSRLDGEWCGQFSAPAAMPARASAARG